LLVAEQDVNDLASMSKQRLLAGLFQSLSEEFQKGFVVRRFVK